MRIADLLSPAPPSPHALGNPPHSQQQLESSASFRAGPWGPEPSASTPSEEFETTQLLLRLPFVRQLMQQESGSVSQAEAHSHFERELRSSPLPADVQRRIAEDVRAYVDFCEKIGFTAFPITASKAGLHLARFVPLPSTEALRNMTGTSWTLDSHEIEHCLFSSLRISATATSGFWPTVHSYTADPLQYKVTREIALRLDQPYRPKVIPFTRIEPSPEPKGPCQPSSASANAPRAPHRDVPWRRPESFGVFISRLPSVLSDLQATYRNSDDVQRVHDAAHSKIRDTLRLFQDPRRSQKLAALYDGYRQVCAALAFAPHPITRIKLGIFALANLEGLCGDHFRKTTAALRSFRALSPTSLEIALDNLGILQQLSQNNPAEADDFEAETSHWRQWRDEMRDSYPTSPFEPSLPPLRDLALSDKMDPSAIVATQRASGATVTSTLNFHAPAFVPAPLQPFVPPRLPSKPIQAPLPHISTLEPSPPLKQRTGRPVGRPRKVIPPPSLPPPRPRPSHKPRQNSDSLEIIGRLPPDRRPPPMPFVLPTFALTVPDDHTIAKDRPRRSGYPMLKMLPLRGSGIHGESDSEEEDMEVRPARTRKRKAATKTREASDGSEESESEEEDEEEKVVVRSSRSKRRRVPRVGAESSSESSSRGGSGRSPSRSDEDD